MGTELKSQNQSGQWCALSQVADAPCGQVLGCPDGSTVLVTPLALRPMQSSYLRCGSALLPGACPCLLQASPSFGLGAPHAGLHPLTPWTVIHRVITRDYEHFTCLCCFTLERIAVGIQNTRNTRGLSRYKELGQKDNKGEKVGEGQSHI